jgi:hypothetical protein
VKERSETLLLHNNLTEVCMAFELVRSAFVCYEVLALRALGVADSRTTHKAPIAARSQNMSTGTLPVRPVQYYRYRIDSRFWRPYNVK